MQKSATTNGTFQIVSFALGGEEYGIEILKIREIHRVPAITRVPNAPSFIEGVINLRCDVVPVFWLGKRFGIENPELTKSSRVIIVELGDRKVGMIVDSVSNVLRLSDDQTEPPPPLVRGNGTRYIQRIGKTGDRLVIILAVEKILEVEELTQLSSAKKTNDN